MKTDFTIRQAQQSDAVELKELFQNTVIVINRRDYSQVEVEDWASCGDDLSNIEEMIKTHYFIVAVNQQSQIVGFSSITPHGYLHSMFVHKDFQGKRYCYDAFGRNRTVCNYSRDYADYIRSEFDCSPFL